MADRETWAKRVAAWRSSGQTVAVFSARRDFAPSTLKWWASRLGRRGHALVRVVPAPAPARDAVLELAVGDARVLVRAGFDRALLVEVLDVLRGRAGS